MACLVDLDKTLKTLLQVRAGFDSTAQFFKEVSEKQTETINLLCGKTSWEFESSSDDRLLPDKFSDNDYLNMLESALSKKHPIEQMTALIKLVDKLQCVIDSYESKMDKIDEAIMLQRKQNADYKKDEEYKTRLRMQKRIQENAQVIVDRYYMVISKFYLARRALSNRMLGLTEKFVSKCKKNPYLIKKRINQLVDKNGHDVFEFIEVTDRGFLNHGR